MASFSPASCVRSCLSSLREYVGSMLGCSAPQVGKLRTDDPEEEKKQKEFKSMLNKLTPNNQEKLLQKFLAVGITEAKTLRNLIDQANAPRLASACLKCSWLSSAAECQGVNSPSILHPYLRAAS